MASAAGVLGFERHGSIGSRPCKKRLAEPRMSLSQSQKVFGDSFVILHPFDVLARFQSAQMHSTERRSASQILQALS